jgi:enoyl-CoA hydratase/carnithine racemase
MTVAGGDGAVSLRLDGAVLWIGLNRPDRHNIYDLAMRDALYAAFGLAAEHPDVGAVVVHGEGANYSAGADLREFGSAPSQDVARRVRFARDVWGRVLDCPHPVVAALHGVCFGSGLELALLCDQRVAAQDAVLALPEMRLGMIPAAGGTQSAPRVAGLGRAYSFLLTGERIDADEARRRGLVEEVVAAGAARHRAGELAAALAALPRPAAALTRDLVRRAGDLPMAAGLRVESALAAATW